MSNFIAGILLNFQPFELFAHVKNGLQPLDQFGKPIPPCKITYKLERLKKLKGELKVLPLEYGKLQTGIVFHKGLSSYSREVEKRKLDIKHKSILNEIGTLESELDKIENKYSWSNCELPEDPKSAEGVFDLLRSSYFLKKDVEAIENANSELLIKVDSESASNQKEKITPKEIMHEHFSKTGKIGGKKEKKNQPILRAITQYLQGHSKIECKSNYHIAESFKKNVRKNEPIIVNFNECEWDVYFADNYIEAIADATNKKKQKDKSIAYSTFMNSYISEAKKIIKEAQNT